MRKLITRLILFLCHRFSIWPVDETRHDMGDEAQIRAQRWEAFAREKGGLFDMLDGVRSEYLAAMGNTPPGEHARIEALAIGAATAEKLRAEVRNIIATGELAAENDDSVEKFATLPSRKSI